MASEVFNIKAHPPAQHESNVIEKARAKIKRATAKQRRKNELLRQAVRNGDIEEVVNLLAKGAYSEDKGYAPVLHDQPASKIAEMLATDCGRNNSPQRSTYIAIAELLHENSNERLSQYERKSRLLEMKWDYFALEKAVSESRLSDVKYLLARRAGCGGRDGVDYGVRELAESLREGRLEIARIMVENGVNVKNSLGERPMTEAVQGPYPDIVQLLLDYGVDPHHVRSSKTNYLMDAAYFHPGSDPSARDRRTQVIRLLLEIGVDPDLSGDTCQMGSAREIVTRRGESDLLEMIEKRFGKAPATAASTSEEFSGVAQKPVSQPGWDLDGLGLEYQTALPSNEQHMASVAENLYQLLKKKKPEAGFGPT